MTSLFNFPSSEIFSAFGGPGRRHGEGVITMDVFIIQELEFYN